jgi:hypothetical protein
LSVTHLRKDRECKHTFDPGAGSAAISPDGFRPWDRESPRARRAGARWAKRSTCSHFPAQRKQSKRRFSVFSFRFSVGCGQRSGKPPDLPATAVAPLPVSFCLPYPGRTAVPDARRALPAVPPAASVRRAPAAEQLPVKADPPVSDGPGTGRHPSAEAGPESFRAGHAPPADDRY